MALHPWGITRTLDIFMVAYATGQAGGISSYPGRRHETSEQNSPLLAYTFALTNLSMYVQARVCVLDYKWSKRRKGVNRYKTITISWQKSIDICRLEEKKKNEIRNNCYYYVNWMIFCFSKFEHKNSRIELILIFYSEKSLI